MNNSEEYYPARLRQALHLTEPADRTPLRPAVVAASMLRHVVRVDTDVPAASTRDFLVEIAVWTERSMWDDRWLNGRDPLKVVPYKATPHRGATLDVLDDLGLKRFSINTDSLEPIFRQGRELALSAARIYTERTLELLDRTPSSLATFDRDYRERLRHAA